MNKKWVIGTSISIILLVFTFIFYGGTSSDISSVCFEDRCFDVELAVTSAEKSQGLMYRDNLRDDEGMLFVYNLEGEYSFWMKNTLISLDIIWIDDNYEIVYIEHSAQPCGVICDSITPGSIAMYVLEINGGISKEVRLNVGGRLSFS